MSNLKLVKCRNESQLKHREECHYCGKAGQLSQCSKCKATLYCSEACQKSEYPLHKKYCHVFSHTKKYIVAPSKRISNKTRSLKGVTDSQLKTALQSFYGENYMIKALHHITTEGYVCMHKEKIPFGILSNVKKEDIENISREETVHVVLAERGGKKRRRGREEEKETPRKRGKETPVRLTEPTLLRGIADRVMKMLKKVWNGAYGILGNINWSSLFNTPLEKLRDVIVVLQTNLDYVLSLRNVRILSSTVATKFGEAVCVVSDYGKKLLQFVGDNYLYSNDSTPNFERGDLIDALEQVGSCAFLMGVYRSSSRYRLNTEIFEFVFRIASNMKNMIESFLEPMKTLARESIGYLMTFVSKAKDILRRNVEQWKRIARQFKIYSTRILVTIVAMISQLTEWAEAQPVNLARSGMELGNGLFKHVKEFFTWIMEKMGISMDSNGNPNRVSVVGSRFLEQLSRTSMVRAVMSRIPGILTAVTPYLVIGWKALKIIFEGYITYSLFGTPSLILFALQQLISLSGDHLSYAAHSIYGQVKRGSMGKWLVAKQVMKGGEKIDMKIAEGMETHWAMVDDVARKMIQLPDNEPFTRTEKMKLLRKMKVSTETVSKAQEILRNKMLGVDKKLPSFSKTWEYSGIFTKVYFQEELNEKEKTIFKEITEGEEMESIAEHIKKTALDFQTTTLQYTARYMRYQVERSSILSMAKGDVDTEEVAQPAIPPERMEIARLASETRNEDIEDAVRNAEGNVETEDEGTEEKEKAEDTLKNVEETKKIVNEVSDTAIPSSRNIAELETNEAAADLAVKTAVNTVDQHAVEEETKEIMTQSLILGVQYVTMVTIVFTVVLVVLYKTLTFFVDRKKQTALNAMDKYREKKGEIRKKIKTKSSEVGKSVEEAVESSIRKEPVFSYAGGYKETLRDTVTKSMERKMNYMLDKKTITDTELSVSNSITRTAGEAIQNAVRMSENYVEENMKSESTMGSFFKQYSETTIGGIRQVFAGDEMSVKLASIITKQKVREVPEGTLYFGSFIRDVLEGRTRDMRNFVIEKTPGFFTDDIIIRYENIKGVSIRGNLPESLMIEINRALETTPQLNAEAAWEIFAGFIGRKVTERIREVSESFHEELQGIINKELNHNIMETVTAVLDEISSDINMLRNEARKVYDMIQNLTGEDFEEAKRELKKYVGEKKSIVTDPVSHLVQSADILLALIFVALIFVYFVMILMGVIYIYSEGRRREEEGKPLSLFEATQKSLELTNNFLRSLGSIFPALASGINTIAWAFTGIIITVYVQSNIAHASEIGKQWTTNWLPYALGTGALFMVGKTLGGSTIGNLIGPLAALTSTYFVR